MKRIVAKVNSRYPHDETARKGAVEKAINMFYWEKQAYSKSFEMFDLLEEERMRARYRYL